MATPKSHPSKTIHSSTTSPLFPSSQTSNSSFAVSVSHTSPAKPLHKAYSGHQIRSKWNANTEMTIPSQTSTPKRPADRLFDLKKELAKQAKELQEKDETIKSLQNANTTLETELLRYKFPLNIDIQHRENEEIAKLKKELEEIKGKVMEKTESLYGMLEGNRAGQGQNAGEVREIGENAALARFELEGLRALVRNMRKEKEFSIGELATRRLLQPNIASVSAALEELRVVVQLVGEVKDELTRVYFENCRIRWY